jgi:small-conductance mechanosensitive channel
MTEQLPAWLRDSLGLIVPAFQVVLIVFVAWLLQRAMRRLFRRLKDVYALPSELFVVGRRVSGFLIYGAALVLTLERLGVSGTVLWTAFTGFAAVAAVAFFAAWSVLSNIFCTVLIFATRPFRLYDQVEILENGEKPGLRGQVVDIGLVYTTLQEPGDGGVHPPNLLQVPNIMFFQRIVRRYRTRTTTAGDG